MNINTFQVEGSESVQVGQYRVPPGVDVFPGVRHLLLDPGHWAKPREFCPERFINADGSTIKNDPYFLPFQATKHAGVPTRTKSVTE